LTGQKNFLDDELTVDAYFLPLLICHFLQTISIAMESGGEPPAGDGKKKGTCTRACEKVGRKKEGPGIKGG